MPDSSHRIIIDTNLWISFLISGNAKLDELLFSKKVVLIFSEELLSEFIRVAHRPKFNSFFHANDVDAILATIEEYAEFVTVETKINLCRDPKDDFLLALALDSNADILLTGDSDLLEIGQIGKARIITMTELLNMM